MSLPRLLRDRLRFPRRLALLLGFGAISASGVQAAAPEIDSGSKPKAVPQQSGKSFGELAVWTEAGRIYVSEPGKAAQELRLGDTTEANYLRQLLEQNGASAASPSVVPNRMIFVGSGGSGIGWVPAGANQMPAKPSVPATGFGPKGPIAPGQTTPPDRPREPAETSPPKPRGKS